MIKFGNAPYLECSSKGDKRFSAFYARPTSLKGKSIEESYQSMKIFEDGSTGLDWRQAKGKKATNANECSKAYTQWWKEWIDEQNLINVLVEAEGLSDMFGQKGHVCQAEVLWNLREAYIKEHWYLF